MSRMPSIGSGSGFLPGEIDSAEHFDGSDGEIVSHTNTETKGFDLGLPAYRSGNINSRDADNSTSTGVTRRTGLVINTNTSLYGVYGEVSANTSGATRAVLYDSTDTIYATAPINNGSFKLYHEMSSGTEYYVTVDADGDSYTEGSYNSGAYPYTGTDLDITATVTDLNEFTSQAQAVNNLEGLTTAETSGTGYIEWPYPDAPVHGWGSVFFERTLNNETVDVYIEEDSGGYTEIAGPVQNGDEIPANPTNNVRFRVEISRTNKSNDPRLDVIRRQEVFANA